MKQIEERTEEILRDKGFAENAKIKRTALLNKKIEEIKEDHRKRMIKFSGESHKSIFFTGVKNIFSENMKKYPSRLLVRLVKGDASPEIKNMLGIYKLQLDNIPKCPGPVQPRYSHVSSNSYTLIFCNFGWEFQVNNPNQYSHVIFSLKKTKNYFNDEVWRNNNGFMELKMTDNNITVHLIAY